MSKPLYYVYAATGVYYGLHYGAPLKDADLVAVPSARPAPRHVWNFESKAWVAEPASIQDVKDECVRRRKAIVGLDADADLSDLDYRINKGNQEAIKLLQIKAKGDDWTAEQSARADELTDLQEALEAVIIRSNEIQLMNPLPHDVTDAALWS